MVNITEPNELNVIVVGAGICGLACAIGLRRAGHKVTILEKSSLAHEIGAAILSGPNASKILISWGYDYKRIGALINTNYWEYNPQGDLTLHKINNYVDEEAKAPYLQNHRVDFHTELKRMALEGGNVELICKSEVASCDPEAGTVSLADGRTYQGDVIVGADGIHSVLRNCVIEGDHGAQPTGHSAYRFLLPKSAIENDPDWSDKARNPSGVTSYIGADRRVVFYPCRNHEFLNVVAILPDTLLREASIESWNAKGNVDFMVNSYRTAGFCERILRLLSKATECNLWQLRDHDPLPTWTKGRVILVGDAAHPMLPHQGQGGSQSIEDGEALGAILTASTSPKDVPARLRTIEAIRKPRASTIQNNSRNLSKGPTEPGKPVNPRQFAEYTYTYQGAIKWAQDHDIPLDGVITDGV